MLSLAVRWRVPLCALCLVGVSAGPASADIGIPVLFEFPALIVVLAVVVLIEAAVYRRRLRIPFRRAAAVSAVANVVSALVGIPVAMLLASLNLSLSYGAGELGSFGAAESLPRLAMSLILIVLVPLFLVTVLVELQVTKRMLAPVAQQAIRAAVWRANAWTYVPLLLWATLGVAG